MELRREVVTAEILLPSAGFEPASSPIEIRWDPILGHTSHLLSGAELMPSSGFDLRELAVQTQASCPFCSERIDQSTPRLPEAIHSAGRIRQGEAVLFPNLLAYAQYSAVSVYSPDRHFLPLEQMTAPLVADNLAAQVQFAAAVLRYDGRARWASINANHMLPSGSSLFHPHLQGSVDRFPSTLQQMIAQVPVTRVHDYVDTERRLDERYLGRLGCADWLVSFAPVGFNEIRAFVTGVSSPAALTVEQASDLAEGITRVLNVYADLGFQSFNMALVGGGPESQDGYLCLQLVCRSHPQPHYRSDVTYWERLHRQAMVDYRPERLAELARARFQDS